MNNLAFSFILTALILAFLGFGVPSLVIVIVFVPLANIFFSRWPNTTALGSITFVSIRSILFLIAAFTLVSGFVLLFGRGQIGYGDSLQMKGRTITLLGYKAILEGVAGIAGLAWISSLLTAMTVGKRTR